MSEIQAAAQLIHEAEFITVLTGAGVSKESGLPTFRDAMEGLWAKYDPKELVTLQAFRTNPKRVWDWHAWRREMIAQAKPNAGHLALTEIQNIKVLQIITQNVDDLHERAGSRDVIHLHGNIARSRCFNNCWGNPTIIDISQLSYDKEATPPACPHCGGHLRPDVVWFGEEVPKKELTWALELSHVCDLMLVVGTSGTASPASELPKYAKAQYAKIIEVNPDYSMISPYADIRLAGASGEILPKLFSAVEALGASS